MIDKKIIRLNMNFPVLEKILSYPKGLNGYRSLSTIEKLCQYYNHPELAFATIHVAGTNGKGSVCTKIANSLQHSGYKTGLYTSPHISDFRERFQINSQLMSEVELVNLFNEIKQVAFQLELQLTFFEMTTFMGFLYFQRKGVEIAVIEAGMGGELDATNVICPLVSVITSIGYDHTEVLGYSLEEITQAKSGIIKKGAPVVIGPDVPTSIIQEKAKSKGVLVFQSRVVDEDFDVENSAIARLAIEQLPKSFTVASLSLDIKPPCRFERYFLEKEFILDVAHNPHGLKRLLQKLELVYPGWNYRFIVGFSKGKEVEECSQLIQEKASSIHLVSGTHARLSSIDEIKDYFPSSAYLESDVLQAMNHALKLEASQREVVVVTGSFFIMGLARSFFLS